MPMEYFGFDNYNQFLFYISAWLHSGDENFSLEKKKLF